MGRFGGTAVMGPAARATQLRLLRTGGCLVRHGRRKPPAANGRDSRAGLEPASAESLVAHAHRGRCGNARLRRRGQLGVQLRLATGSVRAAPRDGGRFGGSWRVETRYRHAQLRRREEDRDHRSLRRASAHRVAGGRTRGVLRHLRRSGKSGTLAPAGRTGKLAREQLLRRRRTRIGRCWPPTSASADEGDRRKRATVRSASAGRSGARDRDFGEETFGPLRRSGDGSGTHPTSRGEQAPEKAHGSAGGRKL